MKDLLQKMKLPIIIIVVIGVIFVAYNMLFKKPADDSTLANNPVGGSSNSADFLPLLLQVQNISFNQGFFNNSIYVSLKDFTQTIVAEDPGRPDPFANALPGDSGSSNVEGLGVTVQTVSTSTASSSAASKSTVRTGASQ